MGSSGGGPDAGDVDVLKAPTLERFGRTEVVRCENNVATWWVIYEAEEIGDFRGGRRVAAFERREDAIAFEGHQ